MATEAKACWSTDRMTVNLRFQYTHLTTPTVVFFRTVEEAYTCLLNCLEELRAMQAEERRRSQPVGGRTDGQEG